jgi:deazaflavin-dependent oxidoreductase (nitroreductase family)
MDAPQRSMTLPERIVARFLVTRFGAWLGLQVLPPIDRQLLYLSRGRLSLSPGQPILLLITIGARSGRRRSTPLLYFEDANRLIVIASNGGQPRHPAWYYNLRAHPQATVFLHGRAGTYSACEAQDEERARLWHRASAYFIGFNLYEQRVMRNIPVMVLTPQ